MSMRYEDLFQMMTETTKFLPAIEIETASNPNYAIIWLHGLGADGNDFVPIVNELELLTEKTIRFVFPHAPERPVSINNGYIMRAWYDIFSSDFNFHQDESGIRDSQNTITALIEREMQRGIFAKNIFLAGFSQGGAMALQVGLRHAMSLGGIVALSCYLPLAETFSAEASAMNTMTPIFMAHGTFDTIIPIANAIASKEKLLSTHCRLEWHEYPIAHSVCGQEIVDINNWLRRIMNDGCPDKS